MKGAVTIDPMCCSMGFLSARARKRRAPAPGRGLTRRRSFPATKPPRQLAIYLSFQEVAAFLRSRAGVRGRAIERVTDRAGADREHADDEHRQPREARAFPVHDRRRERTDLVDLRLPVFQLALVLATQLVLRFPRCEVVHAGVCDLAPARVELAPPLRRREREICATLGRPRGGAEG